MNLSTLHLKPTITPQAELKRNEITSHKYDGQETNKVFDIGKGVIEMEVNKAGPWIEDLQIDDFIFLESKISTILR